MGDSQVPNPRNMYWILRHGRSIPNEKGLIVSSLEHGTKPEFGLSTEGFEQARLAGELFFQELKTKCIATENVRICYSPFTRTHHTAEAVANLLKIPLEGPQCRVLVNIRERYFGPSFELKSHEKYSEIWELDEKNPFGSPEDGESVADVASRMAVALSDLESEFTGCAILLVSHGDPLQILQTLMHEVAQDTNITELSSNMRNVMVPDKLSQHRKFALLTGELRRLA